MKFLVHAEWKERVPGKWFLEHRERTVEMHAKHFGDMMKLAKQRFPGATVTMRQMEEKGA